MTVTLRARLTAAFLAVVLGPVLIGSVFVGGTVAAVSRARSTERLDAAVTAVRTTVDAICTRLRISAETTAAMATGREPVTDAAVAAALDLMNREQSGAARVHDATGRLVRQFGDVPGPWTDCEAGIRMPGRARVSALAFQAVVYGVDRRVAGYVQVAEPVDAALVNRLRGAAGAEIVVIDQRDPPLATVVAERSRQIVRSAREMTTGRVMQTDDGWYIRVLQPTQGQPLWLALATDGGEEQGLFAVLLAVVLLSGVLAVAAAWWLARSTTRPLAELARAADRVAGGDLDARVPVRSADEVGRLATTFNRMTREMQGYVEALMASRDQLRNYLGLLGETLSSTHDLGKILGVILETVMAATGAQAGVVLLMEEPDGRRPGMLSARSAQGLGDRAGSIATVRLALGEGLLGGVAASGEPRRGRVEWDGPQLSPREPRCRTYVAVPFSGTRRGDGDETSTQPGRLLGVLALYDRLGHDDFDDSDLVTLRTFAGQAAVAVENVLLHEETHRLSLTDPLTGLWNYRYLKESVRREVERANRFDRKLAVLAMDLDRFKEINDTYGHPVGDAVLVEFASRVKEVTREVDLAFRQGGEEFVVLLPETDAAGGAKVAERLCAVIRDDTFDVETGDGTGETIRVTVSAGVAVYPDHGRTVPEVLEAADDALYAAKAAGRDTYRVVRSASPAHTSTPSGPAGPASDPGTA